MSSYVHFANNIAAIEKLGEWIAKSGMFGCNSKDQGCVIASQVFITGMPLMEYQKRNMLVSGKPAIPYDAMIAAFQEAGGKIKVVEKSPDAARIELAFDGHTTKFEFTWDQAQKEPLPYNGKEGDIVNDLAAGKTPKLKSKYATPRSRAVMLFARCVSDGIRTVAARVNFGSYTPEEIEDFDGTEQFLAATPAVTTPVVLATAPVVPTAKPAEPPKQTTPESQGQYSVSINDPSTIQHRDKIIELMGELKQSGVIDIVERVKANLERNKIEGGLLGLTISEAETLIHALEHKRIEAWVNEVLVGHVAAKNSEPPH